MLCDTLCPPSGPQHFSSCGVRQNTSCVTLARNVYAAPVAQRSLQLLMCCHMRLKFNILALCAQSIIKEHGVESKAGQLCGLVLAWRKLATQQKNSSTSMANSSSSKAAAASSMQVEQPKSKASHAGVVNDSAQVIYLFIDHSNAARYICYGIVTMLHQL